MPLEIADLRGPQSVTVGDQHHGRVSMSVAIVLAGIVHELFDLASGQVFSNCTVYSVWWAGILPLIWNRKFRAIEADWKDNTLFLYSIHQAPSHPSGLCLATSATCVPHNQRRGFACLADPTRRVSRPDIDC